MENSGEHLRRYFDDVLGLQISLEPWPGVSRLPLVFRNRYRLFVSRLLGSDCLFMMDQKVGRTASNIRRHMDIVQEKWQAANEPGESDHDPQLVIYVADAAGSDERLRLIEQKIPFVIPGNQMYLPMLGMDLREHFRRVQQPVTKFSPSTQAAVILLLVETEPRAYDAVALAERLNYSKMTVSRAFNELLSLELDLIQTDGRARVLRHSGSRRDLWTTCLSLMETPVRHRQKVTGGEVSGIIAGLPALATRSMLAKPANQCLAVTTEQWSEIKERSDLKPTPMEDPDAIEIEMWGYDPALFASAGVCDPFSLYLSLKDETDERVEGALEEMMEAIEW
ncbi:hypothetical protein NZK35_05540 [Stieleria sp. ICT_E10.1]|uniref:hypothetical protein n=1 Tax=Stieleria sedimenti TaxID=2976331 RepID=UPI0021803895|nr:hypothetical protein [Stieleria sedimenti]MCS7466136.1 hypothetical protein [Stieleria sedimenti]